jgi:hypothetical protein
LSSQASSFSEGAKAKLSIATKVGDDELEPLGRRAEELEGEEDEDDELEPLGRRAEELEDEELEGEEDDELEPLGRRAEELEDDEDDTGGVAIVPSFTSSHRASFGLNFLAGGD